MPRAHGCAGAAISQSLPIYIAGNGERKMQNAECRMQNAERGMLKHRELLMQTVGYVIALPYHFN